MNIDDTGIGSEERKLEPTPGWCERAYDAMCHHRTYPGFRALVVEYEAAQKPAEPQTEPQPEQPAAEDLPELPKEIEWHMSLRLGSDEEERKLIRLVLAEVDRRIAAAVKHGAKVGSGTP